MVYWRQYNKYNVPPEKTGKGNGMKNKRILVIVIALSLIITAFMAEAAFAETYRITCFETGCKNYCVPHCYYCHTHKCAMSGCPYGKTAGSNYCSSHKASKTGSYSKKSSYSTKKTSSSSSTKKYSTESSYTNNKKKSSYSSSSRKGRVDTYDVHSYKDSQSFADDKWEEFYDYEDDYDDEDEAYDDAEDYWFENY